MSHSQKRNHESFVPRSGDNNRYNDNRSDGDKRRNDSKPEYHSGYSPNSSLFAPPPAPRVHDPLNPNPLTTQKSIEQVEHFSLISKGTVEEMRLLGCQIIQSGTKLLKM